MARLADLRLSELATLGGQLRRCGHQAGSFEQAARRVVELLYDGLGAEGERDCVLVRLYKTHPMGQLPEQLQDFARTIVHDVDLPPTAPCLTLLATAGDLPEWNDRRLSRGHQAVPLPSAQVADRFPMIAQLFRQFGLEPESLVEPDADLIAALDEKTYNVFHVEQATASPHVPAQDFVAEHGVHAALGFGGVLPTGDLFAVVLFSRSAIPPATADLFRVLALSVKLAVLPYAAGPLLDEAAADAGALAVAPSRSYLLAMEELLDAHEVAVQDQARRLEELHAVEQRQAAQLRALAEISVATGTMTSVSDILDHVTAQARQIIGARQAVASLTVGSDWSQAITSVSLSQEYSARQDYDELPDGSGIYGLVCETNRPMRLTQQELEGHPRWRGFGASAAAPPPMNGWLAAPLVAHNGDNLGLVQLSDAAHGDFTAADEAVLVQLSRLASVSIENARSYLREHDVATSLQQSLLPRVQQLPGFSTASRYLPAADDLGVGGDWYDAFVLPDGRAALVVGDVVGHNLRAARTMALLRHAVRAYAAEDPAPASVVARLDRLMAVAAPEEFATLLYLVADPRTGQLLFTNAGHPPPLLLGAGSGAQFVDAEVHPPVGYLPPSSYTQCEHSLPCAGSVLLYTDGLVERRGRGIDEGLEQLREVAARAPHSPERLLAAVEAELVVDAPDDDIAVIALRRNG